MTEYQFKFSMDKLSDQWKNFYSRPRLNKLYEIVKDCDSTRFDNFVERCLIDSKTAPLGEQFREFRQNELRLTNYYSKTEYIDKIDCEFCGDLGIIIAKSKFDNFEELMFHNCEAGDDQPWQLPKWIPECSQEYDKLKCPLEWFKPEKALSGDKQIYNVINEKVIEWKQRIRKSEKQWVSKFAEARNG